MLRASALLACILISFALAGCVRQAQFVVVNRSGMTINFNNGVMDHVVTPGGVSLGMMAPDPRIAAWYIRSGDCTYAYSGPEWDESPIPPSFMGRSEPVAAIRVDPDFSLHVHAYDAEAGAATGAELRFGGFPLTPRQRNCQD